MEKGMYSVSCFNCFIYSEVTPAARCIGGWLGPTAGLDAIAKKINLYHFVSSNLAIF
jgi:hypothetical protein